ncbi:PP0621 family protein [Limnohabitans sp.]|uniref:PP0621 family protein n=1 Tax=Limnohabitans sp. TaxID=1907725 RepID=UPI003341FF1C
MKYLIWLLVILAVIWAIKRSRRPSKPAEAPKTPSTSPSNMVGCAHCGLHLPQEEAVAGTKGLYCSTEHRAAAQDRNPV